MTLLKTLVTITDENGEQDGLLDTITWKDDLWLVWKWRPALAPRYRTPARAIRLTGLRYQRPAQPHAGENFVLLDSIPSGILDGTASSIELSGYEISESLPVEIPIPAIN